MQTFTEVQRLLPPLSTFEREQLKESMKAHGFIGSVLAWNGTVIDGHHRYQVWKELTGQEPPIDHLDDLTEDEAFTLAIALNVARRQLSTEQSKQIMKVLRERGHTQEETAEILGVERQTIDNWEEDISNAKNGITYQPPDLRVSVPRQEYATIYERIKQGESQRQVAADYKITQPRISQICDLVEARENTVDQELTAPFPEAVYSTIVIDPPWPIKKIEREVRPNQGRTLEYPVMSLDEIKELPIQDLANPEGCHIYLWVTQKYLPTGLELFEKWGVKYHCLLTWLKPSGITPFSWQFNTEHALFGQIGYTPLEKLGLKLGFTEERREHSRKPEKFYEMVLQASPEPRIELFARQTRQGFTAWGNEIDKFSRGYDGV